MHPLLAAAVIASLTTSALAQELPSPAIAGSGESTQTLGLVSDTIVITVNSAGALDTRRGEASGGLSVDVNGLTVGIGSERTEQPGPDEQRAAAGGTTGIATGTVTGGAVAGSDEGACVGEADGVALSAAQIARLGVGTEVLLAPACGPALDPEQRAAVAGNDALTRLIAAHGLALDELVSITILRDVVVLGYLQRS